MRKIITTTAHYVPTTWGLIDEGGEITAFAKFSRGDMDSDYDVYGDDADAYKKFELDGFTKTQVVQNYAEGYKWLKDNAESEIGA